MRRFGLLIVGALVSACCVVLIAQAQNSSRRKAPPKRATPPKWSDDVRGVFFKDAREKLVGQRPDFLMRRATAGRSANPDGSATGEAPAGGATTGDRFDWSRLIWAETIEDEIKAQKNLVSANVTTPTKFKGGDYRRCRTSFSVLAAMFGLAAEFDEEIRWKKEASGLRDQFSRAGGNCKVGTDQSYAEAKQRRDDLEELVRGGRFDTPKPREDWKWHEVADRPPLMKRLEVAQKERLLPWSANQGEFKRNLDGVWHEAQIVAAIAEIIQREEYEYWDDDSYLDYAKQVGKAAQEITKAVERNDYQSVRKAVGEMTKSCSECHEDYRA